MTDENIDVWAHYTSSNEDKLVDRLRNTGPIQDENGTWTGRFPSWQDAHAAATQIESLERRVAEYEETIRYLTLQLGKTL